MRDVGLVRDGPASWLLAPSSEVPLQERRVSESESVSAVTRRDCRDHFGCSVPILLRAPHTIHQIPVGKFVPRAAVARRRAGILTNKPERCTCREMMGSWCDDSAYCLLTFLQN